MEFVEKAVLYERSAHNSRAILFLAFFLFARCLLLGTLFQRRQRLLAHIPLLEDQ